MTFPLPSFKLPFKFNPREEQPKINDNFTKDVKGWLTRAAHAIQA